MCGTLPPTFKRVCRCACGEKTKGYVPGRYPVTGMYNGVAEVVPAVEARGKRRRNRT